MDGNLPVLRGKRVLITGAGKGIGRNIALAFAQNGAEVCVSSRTAADLDEVTREISANFGSKAVGIQADVSKDTDASRLVVEAVDRLGGLDVIVCAAGYPLKPEMWDTSIHELSDTDFLKVFEVDLLGSFRVAKHALPHFVKQKSGVVILFSSTPALSGYNKGAPYTVGKAAVLGLSREIAAEYGPYNVRSYAIAPGNIKTSSTFDKLSPGEQKTLAQEAPMGRWGDPREVANVCVVLASDYLSFVTGQTIVVDGGTVML